MSDQEQEGISTRVALLERDVASYDKLLYKLDTTIDNINKISNDIGKLLAVHDNQITTLQYWSSNHEKEDSENHKQHEISIEELKRQITLSFKELTTLIDTNNTSRDNTIGALDKRIASIESYWTAGKWLVIGGVFTLGLLLHKLPDIASWFVTIFGVGH